MIRDMEDPVSYPRLEHIMNVHLKKKSNDIWYLMVDPSADVSFETIEKKMTNYVQYKRWLVYSLAPDETKLSKDDYRGLYSPDANRFRQLTHQLLALWILREKGHSEDGISEEDIDDLINTLCERIAGEMVWDFRVTDLYLQRVACILAAGRPDLIKRRWIERILTNQTSDGGFRRSWYRWGPGAFTFNSTSPPTDHATVQAVWLLYMLMHRYPDWVEENFSD
jgi:hypothetical protein